MKPQSDRLVRQGRQIVNALPADSLQSFIGRYWNTILRSETRDNLSRLVKNFDSQFALWIVHVDE